MINLADQQTVIDVLINTVSLLLDEDEGIVVDTEQNRYIVGKSDNEICINLCCMDGCDEEFKNVESGTRVQLKETVDLITKGEIH